MKERKQTGSFGYCYWTNLTSYIVLLGVQIADIGYLEYSLVTTSSKVFDWPFVDNVHTVISHKILYSKFMDLVVDYLGEI